MTTNAAMLHIESNVSSLVVCVCAVIGAAVVNVVRAVVVDITGAVVIDIADGAVIDIDRAVVIDGVNGLLRMEKTMISIKYPTPACKISLTERLTMIKSM